MTRMLPALGLAVLIVIAAGAAAGAESSGGGAAPIDDARVAELLRIIDDLRAEVADLRRDAGLARPRSATAPRTAVRSSSAPSTASPMVAPPPLAPAPSRDPLPMLRLPMPPGVSTTAPAPPPPSRAQGMRGAIAGSMPSGGSGPPPEWRGAPAPGAPPGGPGAEAEVPGGGAWNRAAVPMAGGHDDSLRREIAEVRAMMRELIDLVRGLRDQLEHGRGHGAAAWPATPSSTLHAVTSPAGALHAVAPPPVAATPR